MKVRPFVWDRLVVQCHAPIDSMQMNWTVIHHFLNDLHISNFSNQLLQLQHWSWWSVLSASWSTNFNRIIGQARVPVNWRRWVVQQLKASMHTFSVFWQNLMFNRIFILSASLQFLVWYLYIYWLNSAELPGKHWAIDTSWLNVTTVGYEHDTRQITPYLIGGWFPCGFVTG